MNTANPCVVVVVVVHLVHRVDPHLCVTLSPPRLCWETTGCRETSWRKMKNSMTGRTGNGPRVRLTMSLYRTPGILNFPLTQWVFCFSFYASSHGAIAKPIVIVCWCKQSDLTSPSCLNCAPKGDQWLECSRKVMSESPIYRPQIGLEEFSGELSHWRNNVVFLVEAKCWVIRGFSPRRSVCLICMFLCCVHFRRG